MCYFSHLHQVRLNKLFFETLKCPFYFGSECTVVRKKGQHNESRSLCYGLREYLAFIRLGLDYDLFELLNLSDILSFSILWKP